MSTPTATSRSHRLPRCRSYSSSVAGRSIATEISYRVQRHAFDYLDAPVRRICQSDTPFAFATSLIDAALPQVGDIVRAVKDVAYVA